MKLTIDQLALEVSDEFDTTKAEAKRLLLGLFEVITENMEQGHEVSIPGFGKFRVKQRAARMARNPKTGEQMEVPAKTVPNFLAAKALKERVNIG